MARFHTTHYIAIMAAWLLGLERVPAKLTALNELKKLFCHKPWLIDHTHIEQLIKGGSQWSWSVNELIITVTKGVDTSQFRRTLWYYIYSLFVIRYYDYDYNQNKFFTCLANSQIHQDTTDRVTQKDSIMKEFIHSEKVWQL